MGKSRQVKLQKMVALGILDAYRREQALADAQKASASDAGVDEETCPAECVRDIYSGALPGALHGQLLNLCRKRSSTGCETVQMFIVTCYSLQWRILTKHWRTLEKKLL